MNFLLVLDSPEFQNLEIFPPFFRNSRDELFRDFGYHNFYNDL